jgi:hypothetical protein
LRLGTVVLVPTVKRLQPGALEPGVLEAWRPGGLEAWRPGGLEAWRPGGLEAWRIGGLDGDSAAWRSAGWRVAED